MPVVTQAVAAEFDIDHGSTLTADYPPTCSSTEAQYLAEHMIPEQAHGTLEARVLTVVRRAPELSYMYSIVQTKKSETARRGAVVRAVGIVSDEPWIDAFRPLLALALEAYLLDTSIPVAQALYEGCNAIDVSRLPVHRPFDEAVLRRASIDAGPCSARVNSRFGSIPFVLDIPLMVHPEEVCRVPVRNLVSLLATKKQEKKPDAVFRDMHTYGAATHPISLFINAIWAQRRVLFYAHGSRVSTLVEMVLAACQLASGMGAVVPHIMKRAFPYTSLFNLDELLDTPGYVAGVVNPAFVENRHWWDVLVNVDTGELSLSPNVKALPVALPPRLTNLPPETESFAVPFPADLVRLVADHRHSGQYTQYNVQPSGQYTQYSVPPYAQPMETPPSTPSAANSREATPYTASTSTLYTAGTPHSASTPHPGSLPHSASTPHPGSVPHTLDALVHHSIVQHARWFVDLVALYETECLGIDSELSPFGLTRSINEPAHQVGQGLLFPSPRIKKQFLHDHAATIEAFRRSPSYTALTTHRPRRPYAYTSYAQSCPIDLQHQVAYLGTRAVAPAEMALVYSALTTATQSRPQSALALAALCPPASLDLVSLLWGLHHGDAGIRRLAVRLVDALASVIPVQAMGVFLRSAYHRARLH